MTEIERRDGLGARAIRDWKRYGMMYALVLPVLVYLFLFSYRPMYGVIIAFEQYRPSLGFLNSPWVGLEQFVTFFNGVYFERVLFNTFYISFTSILWGFPAPILLALLLNELKSVSFKRIVQTVSYMPYFISIVVICGLIRNFSLSDGLFNNIIVFFGGERSSILSNSRLFVPIYVASGIWQHIGWDSIIYLAALTGIDLEQYEAARIDGAGRFRQAIHITLPGISPVIVMMLILRMGGILNVGYEKILLLYQPMTYGVAEVISTHVYRVGLIEGNWSYSTAINLFNSLINILFLLGTNWLCKRLNGSGLF